MPRKRRPIALPSPYLRRVWFDGKAAVDWSAYPFNLPLFAGGAFELAFEAPVTIIVGENGSGKSTLLEGIAALAGFDEAGGGKGYRLVDHSGALDKSGTHLEKALRASWLPKLTNGWFFRAESFYSIARSLDSLAVQYPLGGGPSPDFLSHSHGEGFLRFFLERLRGQALYIFDEPESALSPKRQVELVQTLMRLEGEAKFQIVMATHSPLLMAYPGATLLQIDGRAMAPVRLEDTAHFRMLKAFVGDPQGFLANA